MISIITASYNRAYIIEELYHSLQRQKSFDFEWIVIDDGSADDTYEKVSDWSKAETNFPISVYTQKNGGKHRAVNRGVGAAKGGWCFIVDSDDILADDAVATIHQWIKNAEANKKIAAVAGQKGGMSNHQPIGGFPQLRNKQKFVDAKNTDRRKLNLLGDKAEVYRTEILRTYPFMTYEGENFMSESTVWDEIAYQGYYVRWYPQVIYYCDYLSDGLTHSGDTKEKKNYQGFTYLTKQRIKCHGLLEGLIARGYYYHVSKSIGKSVDEVSSNLGNSKFLTLLSFQIWKLKNLIYKR